MKFKTATTPAAIALVFLLASCAPIARANSSMMGDSSNYYPSKVNCVAPASLPTPIVTVSLGDMGMTRMMGGTASLGSHMRLRTSPQTFHEGRVTILVTNYGWRTHELVVLPLAKGQRAGQRVIGTDGKVDEKGSLGEASNNCGSGTGEGIKAGSISWITLTLKAGNYEFICNLKNHYADGMFQEIVVTK